MQVNRTGIVRTVLNKNARLTVSDDELLISLAGGDKRAFMTLYARHRERLFVYCCRMLGEREAAKDALQESMLKAFQNAPMYQQGTNGTAWLFRLTRNTCIDMLRARKDHDTIEDLQIAERESQSDVLLQDALTDEIEQLPEIYREAVILRDVQGHSYDEIAQITGTSLSTVKFRIFKARDTLRQRLATYLTD